MTAFFLSPEAATLLGIVLIICLIGAGIKSVGKSLGAVDHTKYKTWKEFKKEVGPMTWQERIVSVILIALFVAFVIWLAEIT